MHSAATGEQVSRTNRREPAGEVEAFLENSSWREELTRLRAILLESGLDEEVKWGKPCYSLDGGKVALLQGFKHFCALLFPKGALLPDPDGILAKPGENTQAARRVEFGSVDDVDARSAAIRACLREAVAVEKAGLKVDFKETGDYPVPMEFQQRLDADPGLKAAFEGLTPGRQRAYLLYFAGAKQSATRASRVEKCLPRILDGKGPRDP